jgi:probable rRNA maturation factor
MKPGSIQSGLLFQHPSRRVRRKELRAFWMDLTLRLAKSQAAFCLITGDADLQAMNRQFRHKDYATDVLSFPAQDETGCMLGEIAISLDRASAQAAELGHGIEEELRILMLHGLLHLTGLDHEVDSGQMARAETRWRKQLGLPLGLIERASVESKSKPVKKAGRR